MINKGKMKEIRFILIEICLSLKICLACDGPLGMSNGIVKDWQITASSTFPSTWDPDCHERFSRIFIESGKAWCAKHRSDSEWLQIDLGVAAKVTGVITQGRTGRQEWVASFMISYSTDAFQWQYVTDRYGNQRIFQGNLDDYNLKHNYLDKSVRARFIKFHTIEWSKHPSLRVEIIGCQECNQILGTPPYGRYKASSTWPYRHKLSCQPQDGNLLSNKGWCSRKRLSNEQWLEIDVGHPSLITGLVTKGRGDTNKNQWVTKYKAAYSNDSLLWTYYKDANHLEPKEFGGNADADMERTHYLNNPFTARFVRFYPTQWNEQVAMRAGVLGCPYKGSCLPGYFRVNDDSSCVENLAYRKEVWTNEKKPINEVRSKKNSGLKARSFVSLIHAGHASLAVDGDDDNVLEKCALIDNYFTERPILVIDLSKMVTIGGIIIKTWQGKGQSANITYRDYMFGLDRFTVFVDKDPLNPNLKSTSDPSNLNVTQSRLRFSENNLCNFVTRNNYAIFSNRIHLQCLKPLTGRYLYIQADGRNNRWNKLFNAVFCEVQVYEI